MSEPMPIEYASDALEQPADRLLRHIVGWSGIAYGGKALLGSALHVALAKGWVATPPNMSWSFDGRWDLLQMVVAAMTNTALLCGGVLLLNRSRSSVIVLRASAGFTIALAVVGLAMAMRQNATYASYWSTPATATSNALGFLGGLWLPVLIVLLTLPPLARRMV
ncbi:MAG TPA: hypothetical protein VGR35_16315 [Tepidisphaeraceae bacterium]|nr:hypothetical protein [Tepidisphaeraceae bacterium]